MHPLQTHLPYRPWSDPGLKRLPGVMPIGDGPWLIRDEAFAGQMALRDRLLAERRGDVLAEADTPAVREMLATVVEALRGDDAYGVGAGAVRRPDGVTVALDSDTPIAVLARLVQEDLLLHERQGDEHVLTAGTLLFPSSWTLAQKLGHPLSRIHRPVPAYDAGIERRVQRIFDMLRPGTPLWRANWLTYRDPDLFHPLREGEDKPAAPPGGGYLRSERQSFLKLPESGAVVFGIHTYVLPIGLFAGELPAGNGRDHAGPGGVSGAG